MSKPRAREGWIGFGPDDLDGDIEYQITVNENTIAARRYRPLPAGFEDRITSAVTVHLSFPDRVKVLFGVEVQLSVEHTVQHAPGKIEVDTVTEPLLWPWVLWWRLRGFRRRVGYVEVEESTKA